MNDARVPGELESDSPGFPEFGLKTALLETLRRLGHAVPTPIQRKAIPVALTGVDVIGCAQTGTGKTAAFCLPLLQRFDDGRGRQPGRVRALVLSPTRELAAQIGESLAEYGRGCAVSHTVVFGGVGQSGQARDLRRGVDVLVATPGRLEDLMNQGIADLSHVEVLILDEVDRMLDQGFLPAVRRISGRIPRSRQTLMFSATLPKELRLLARDLLRNPTEVAADHVASTPLSIEQKIFLVDPALKRQALERLLVRSAFTRALVFTRTKHGADRVARHLNSVSLEAESIHGGKSQSSRERTLAAFREGSLPILVATDLAARGLHVDDISHVINYDLPVDADSYVHRIGRTARAGASGEAISLCSQDERECLQRIERLIQRKFELTRDPSLTDRIVDGTPQRMAPPAARGGATQSRQRPNEREPRGRADSARQPPHRSNEFARKPAEPDHRSSLPGRRSMPQGASTQRFAPTSAAHGQRPAKLGFGPFASNRAEPAGRARDVLDKSRVALGAGSWGIGKSTKPIASTKELRGPSQRTARRDWQS